MKLRASSFYKDRWEIIFQETANLSCKHVFLVKRFTRGKKSGGLKKTMVDKSIILEKHSRKSIGGFTSS